MSPKVATHSRDRNSGPLSHLNKLLGLFLVVIPEAVVNPETQQLQGGLRAKEVDSRHVEIIQEAKQTLPPCRHKLTLGPLLHATLYDGLDIGSRGLGKDEEPVSPVSALGQHSG